MSGIFIVEFNAIIVVLFADLYKSEVYAISKLFGIVDEILKAKPTDGLWDDDRDDETQMGATYDELEWVMEYLENNPDYNLNDLFFLTKKELQLLDKVSRGEDVSEDEKELIDKITRRDSSFEYDPRKDDDMVFDFDGWSNEEIDLERLNNLWNDIDDDAIDHFFSYYKIDKNIYLNNNGNLPGEIPSDLVGRFEEFIRNIY